MFTGYAKLMDIKKIKNNSAIVAEVLKVLSHPQRLCILCHLSEGSKTVSELQNLCEISQSHVSQFLSKMKLQELVECRKQGNYVYYSIKDEKVLKVLESLHGIYCDIGDEIDKVSLEKEEEETAKIVL